MPSAGFIVITIVATMLVIVPSVAFFLHGLRSGTIGRIISLLAFALLLLFGWAAFTDPEVADFESRAFFLYVTWGFTLYSGVTLYILFWLVRSFLRRRHS